VQRTERRLSEAARLGFRRALVPRSAPDAPAGLRLDRATSIGEALHHLAFLAQPVAS
jgi:predicted ATP-dependent serine protease